jgi:hypothetical protein
MELLKSFLNNNNNDFNADGQTVLKSQIGNPPFFKRGFAGCTHELNVFDFQFDEAPSYAFVLIKAASHGGSDCNGDIIMTSNAGTPDARIFSIPWKSWLRSVPTQFQWRTEMCPANLPEAYFCIPKNLLQRGSFQVKLQYNSGLHGLLIFNCSVRIIAGDL